MESLPPDPSTTNETPSTSSTLPPPSAPADSHSPVPPPPARSNSTFLHRRPSLAPAPSSASIHASIHRPVWGEEMAVGTNVGMLEAGFHDLQRALTGSTHQEEWSLEKQLRDVKTNLKMKGVKDKRLSVAWKGLSVRGEGKEAIFGEDILSIFNPFRHLQDARRQKRAQQTNPSLATSSAPIDPNLSKNERYLLHDFNGVLKAGEMALVVGRPGSGCSTFLKTITNLQEGYAGVDGDVFFGDMTAKEAKQYPGQIIFNAEDDTHYPVLTVAQTLEFALKMKTPRIRPDGLSRKQYEAEFLDAVLKTFGIEHCRDTIVGNENIRGISGGERKRVSIAEVLINRASVVGWDNTSRGLDASTALEYTRSIRTLTDVLGSTSFVSLYQAGNSIYDIFDKVMVIAAGQCIYWGPRAAARPYFEGLGFVVAPGSNVADFLTGVTVQTEAIINEKMRGSTPITIDDFVAAYKSSDVCKAALQELEDHLAAKDRREEQTAEFRSTVKNEQAKWAFSKAPFTSTLWTQVMAATVQTYQLMWNDKASIIIKQGTSIAQSIILGSLFYDLPENTNGLFTRAGVLFFICLWNALLGMTEVTASFEGRSILSKHKSFAMYRPSAVILAKCIADFPILIGQVTAFLLPVYFMTNLKRTAEAFWTLWISTYVVTLSLIALFRAIGYNFPTFERASAVSGLAVAVLLAYSGYLIAQSDMKPWLGWTRYLNPLYFAFETAMGNEFTNQAFPCVGTSLIPQGPGYVATGTSFTCTVAGSVAGESTVSGDAYLAAGLTFYHSHIGRNIGIVVAFWIAFVIISMIGVERLKGAGSSKSYLLFQRTKDKSEKSAIVNGTSAVDEEQGGVTLERIGEQHSTNEKKTTAALPTLEKSTTVFTWRNVDYTVDVKGGKLPLLSQVQGYTKPGSLTALMGASGAGKTTLLDVLALRKDDGVVSGSIHIDGRELGKSFQRTTGYVGQLDIHEPTATVREALIFSALLRQPADTPYEEKIAFVDTVIDLLELTDLQHAFIGDGLAGLGVEQRKRVTIGVELVAKPLLLFLDEPTSGLDGQSSFNILRFLRKLADAGQAMICTIHQPSALLFDQFDRLLLLARGGHTVYFGEIGDHGATMKDYFARNGIVCPADSNPAEFMIDVVSGSLSKGKDWSAIWLESPEFVAVTKEIEELDAACAAAPPSFVEDGKTYAVSQWRQIILVSKRSSVAMFRSVDYLRGKLRLHIGIALLNGLSFLQLDNSVISLQDRLFTVFLGCFIAPGLIVQLQPRVIDARNLFEARENQSRMFGWLAFVIGQIMGELPWMFVSTTIYYVLWYFVAFPVGLMTDASHAGGMWVSLILFHTFTLLMGFAIAALAQNKQQAALVIPMFLAIFSSFSGVLVPYSMITAFWRYWLYYINPWTYAIGGALFFSMRNTPVVCNEREFARFTPVGNATCGEYLKMFLIYAGQGYVDDPSSTTECKFCSYSNANQYLARVNITHASDGGRNMGIIALYAVFTLGLVFVFMWARARPKKKKVKTA